MALPDISRLRDVPAETLQSAARHLRDLGLTPARVAPIVSAAAVVHPALRRPIRNHHLRRIQEPVGHAMRMWLFSDPVSAEEARAAMGPHLEVMLETGLLQRQGDGKVVSPFVLGLFNDLFLLSDELSHGGDGVMGFGGSTIDLCRAAFPEKRVGRALDLGCGSGTAALVLAAAADHVVATDINPRALVLAAVNAKLNGITNVEMREGDLFEPVRGERFDLVVSQPPFVPMREGAGDAVFLYGGRRGDELALGLLSKITPHVAPGGRAVLRVDWPEYGDDSIEHRLRVALGDKLDLLLLSAPRVGPDEHAATYASGIYPTLGREFENEAIRLCEHLSASGIRALVPTFLVLSPAGARPCRTDTLEVRPLERIGLTSGRIDRLLAARDLQDQPERLLTTRLRVPESTVLAQEQINPGDEVESTLHARFPDSALVHPMQLTPDLLFLVTFLHQAEDVRAGLTALAGAYEIPFETAQEQALPAILRALAGGLLELPS